MTDKTMTLRSTLKALDPPDELVFFCFQDSGPSTLQRQLRLVFSVSVLGLLSLKQIANTTHRLQINRVLRVSLDFLPQVPDVDIDVSWCDESVPTPHCIQQLVAGEDLVGLGSQAVEEAELQPAQWHVLAGPRNPVGIRVDKQPRHFDGLPGFTRQWSPPQ
jgi:hypothetical protein